MTIAINTRIRVLKGCKARDVNKGETAVVTDVTTTPEYGTRVVLAFRGKTQTWWLRYEAWLQKPVVRLNTGNPLNTIEIEAIRV